MLPIYYKRPCDRNLIISKGAAAKILKDLHEKRQIEGRESGKSVIYHTIQVNCRSKIY